MVLKDPNLIQVLDEAAALFPQCIRIVCLRDPRDITASFVQIGQRQPTDGKPGKYRKRDIGFIANKILAAYLPWMESLSQRTRTWSAMRIWQATQEGQFRHWLETLDSNFL